MVKRTCLGQAVLEFAIFASFLLLCLGILIQTGMYTLFSDNLRMTAFRRTIRLAQLAGMTNSIISPYISVAVIRDQFIPSPGRHFGAADTVPVSASYSPVYTTRLRQVPSTDSIVNHRLLPMLWLDINGAVKQYRLSDYLTPTDYLGPCAGFRVKKDVDNVADGPPGVWWEWARDTTKCGGTDYLVYASSKDKDNNYYIDGSNPVWFDADGDGVEETPFTVMQAVRSDECNPGSSNPQNCHFLDIAFSAPTEGDINSYAETVNPTTGIKEAQRGLQDTYTKIRNSNNSVNRTETPSIGIKTRGIINNRVTIRRTVKLNNGSSHEWDSTVNQNIQENF